MTNASGSGIENVWVKIYRADMNEWLGGWLINDANGEFMIVGLPVGQFKLFFDANTNSLPYLSEWYSDKADWNTADPVTVTAGATTTGIDAQLASGINVSLTVTSPNGGENWTAGSSHNITWTSTGVTGNIGILYTTNNGSNWNQVVSNTENDGVHPWIVPDSPSTSCWICVYEDGGRLQ